MKKIAIIAFTALLFASCNNYDDFEFSGVVVDYEECSLNFGSFGYAVQLTSPDSIGKPYLTRDSIVYENVVVIYGADRMLHDKDEIYGRIFLDPKYSKTECVYHYLREAPEARFTKLEVRK